MKKKIEKVRVDLKERSYNILIGSGILNNIGQYVKKLSLDKSIVVLTDPTVDKLYGEKVKNSLKKAGFKVDLIIIPSGEKYKNLDIVSKISCCFSLSDNFPFSANRIKSWIKGGVADIFLIYQALNNFSRTKWPTNNAQV